MYKKFNKDISYFDKEIHRGIESGVIKINKENTRIIYFANRKFETNLNISYEKVRATCFVHLVLDYKYPKDRIDFNVLIKQNMNRICLLVYEDNLLKKPYIIFDCREDGISDTEFNIAIENTFIQAKLLKAKYFSVIAGTTKATYFISNFTGQISEKNSQSDIPEGYRHVPKYKFVSGHAEKDLIKVSREELINTLDKCHKTIWQGGKLEPTTAFDEVSKLLFCKLKDEITTPVNQYYSFQIGNNETATEVYQRIEKIYQNAKLQHEDVFTENIRLDPRIVYTIVSHLQGLAINKVDLDVKGVAFERFMQKFFKGKMGQYFTPRELVHFAVAMINPDKNMSVLDPACGSGGFLLNTLDIIRESAKIQYNDPKKIFDCWNGFSKNKLFGIEINEQITRICKMSMIIHEDGHTNIINYDSLEDFENIKKINKNFKKNNFDLVLTNPPFGALIKSSEKNYLRNYVLGYNGIKERKNQKSEILFLERCIEFLKPKKGKMAIILPDGILTNSSLQYVRDYIMTHCKILAVVSLPQTAFNHYGAGVKSSLLFVRRKGKTEKLKNYPIFMAIADYIGYDSTGKETPDKNDLPEILTAYREFEKRNEL